MNQARLGKGSVNGKRILGPVGNGRKVLLKEYLSDHDRQDARRSVAVDPRWRRKGIAHALCDALVRHAREQGVRRLYLLTTDADRYFGALGFTRAERATLPAEVRATTQFTQTCPQSAIAILVAASVMLGVFIGFELCRFMTLGHL